MFILHIRYCIIIDNKTMSSCSEAIISEAMHFIIGKLDEGLKVAELLMHQSQYTAFLHQNITFQLVFSSHYPQPKRCQMQCVENAPINIELDHNATFMLSEISIPHEERETRIEHEPSSQQKKPKRLKKQSSLIVSEPDNGVFALSEPLIEQEDTHLQEEITQIKRHLNFMRRLRRENQDEQKKRYEQILNRKHLQLPSKDYTFDFNGEFLFKTKQNLKKSLAVMTKGKSEDITEFTRRKKNIEAQEVEEPQRDMLISQDQSNSREGKRILFGNSGKRQISHLPIIKLADNIKLSQNLRCASGIDTSRYTLKSYQSRGESTFKHFAELEKQKTERVYSLKKSSKFTDMTEQEVEEKAATTQVQGKRQSKRMQKYLKKLCEDRSRQCVAQLNKSSNFDRINSPHGYSIHRYYKHNFDDDKRSICQSSLMSLRLNKSLVRQNKAELA